MPHRATVSYRTFMRSIAHKSAKTRAAKKARQDAAAKRRLAKLPSEQEVDRFRREREEWIATQIIWAAAQRGERGIAQLRRQQLKVRSDCILCRRPFSDADRAALGAGTRGVSKDRV